MIYASSITELRAATQATRSYAEACKVFSHIGENSGRAFRLQDGETISFPNQDEILLTAPTKKIAGQDRQLLHVSCKRSSGWCFLPCWVLRKKTRKEDEETAVLRDHNLYQALLHASNDLERVSLLCGKIFKVAETVATTTDKDGKEYEVRIFLLSEEVAAPKRGKSSK